MHELSIAMSIVDLAQEEADRRGGVQIKAVHLRLRLLSGVVPHSCGFRKNPEPGPLSLSLLLSAKKCPNVFLRLADAPGSVCSACHSQE